MRRCGTCGADDRADRRVIETLPPTDRFVDPYLCDDSFHEPPDLYDPGEPRPDPTRYAEWRKNGAGWGRR